MRSLLHIFFFFVSALAAVKSPNLLVGQNWEVKIADFNLSFVGQSAEGPAGASNPRWLAPEVLQEQPATTASDVFGFGLVSDLQ